MAPVGSAEQIMETGKVISESLFKGLQSFTTGGQKGQMEHVCTTSLTRTGALECSLACLLQSDEHVRDILLMSPSIALSSLCCLSVRGSSRTVLRSSSP